METLQQDLRYGVRLLAKSPGFTALAVLTLALGIGANTAVLSLLNALFLSPLPVREPARLVNIYGTQDGRGYGVLSYPDYEFYRDHNHAFEDLAAHYSYSPINLAGSGESKEINGSVVTGTYFHLLGIEPFLGRFIQPDDDRVPLRDPVAVLSHGLWKREFGSDPKALGRAIRLNGTLFTIVGVAPPDFQGVVPGGLATEVWIPSTMFRVGYRYCDVLSQRDCHIVELIGRLRQGHSLADSQAEMNVLARQLEASYPDVNRGRGVAVLLARGMEPGARGGSIRVATLLLVAVGVLLLIACANLAGLLLSRNTSRQKEIAVRLALGATRGRLVRQLLTESLLLSLLGGGVGLIVASSMNDLILMFYAANDEGQRSYLAVGLDPLVLVATAGISLAAGIAFGLVPALQASSPSLVPALKESSLTKRLHPARLRNALVVTQLALSIALLVGMGLVIRSLRNVYRGPGFDPSGVVLLRLRPALVTDSPAEALAFQKAVIERIQATPGVLSVSPAERPPQWSDTTAAVWLPGRAPERPRDAFQAAYNVVGPLYFKTLAISLLRGREFDERDGRTAPKVAIVNETLSRRFWPEEGGLGKVLVAGGVEHRVVGVVRDAQYFSAAAEPVPFLYLSFWQEEPTETKPVDSRTHVRVAGEPRAMLPIIRREIAAVDPRVPVSEDRPLTEWLEYSFMPVRMATTMLTCFAALALFLSAIGLYGTVSFMVGQRTREIAIRVALGARRQDVAMMVARQGALLALVGTGAGLVAALLGGRLLASLLYGVPERDPLTLLLAPAVLLGVAALASYLPTRRAMRIAPMTALRSE